MKLLLILLLTITQVMAQTSPEIGLIPWPQNLNISGGELELKSKKTRIVYTKKELQPLAEVLRQEIYQITSRRYDITDENPKAGDIVLKINSALSGETYTFEVDDKVTITASNYKNLAMASVSLLQAVEKKGSKVTVPRLSITDSPHSSFRSLMVDVARQPHTIDTLKQCVVLCRMYKVNFLQLHLTDDQSFTFESKAYPKLATPGRHFKQRELKKLVAFADARGVTIIPEFDVPAHTTAMRRAMPELFGRPGLSVINIGKPEVYRALFTIVEEMCEVFKSSPYFHIGADEAYFGALAKDPIAIKAVKDKGFDNVHDLFLELVVRMNKHVKKQGKRTIMWESFRGTGSRKVKIPKDIYIMAWETLYQKPQSLLDNGYTIMNVSWKPTYLTPGRRWNPDYIYGWNMFRWENHWKNAPSYNPIQLKPHPNDRIIGGMMCSWESRDEMQIPGVRLRIAPLLERFWTPNGKLPYSHFATRFKHTDQVLQKLIRPVTITARGLTHPDYVGPFYNRENHFADKLTLDIKPQVAHSSVHYTTDGSIPTSNSPRFTKHIVLDKSTFVRAQAFDIAGNRIGFVATRPYEFRPIKGDVSGLLMSVPYDEVGRGVHRTKFGNALNIRFSKVIRGGWIRFTLDGTQPTAQSPTYTKPIILKGSAVVTAGYFDANNQLKGELWRRKFDQIDAESNLTTGRPVKASKIHPDSKAEYVVDGIVDRNFYWDGNLGPQWWQVDLEDSYKLDRVQVITYWDGRRHYRYNVEVSLDGKSWNKVVDFSKNSKPATATGFMHKFDPIIARYIRVNMQYNSANPSMHLVEVRAFSEANLTTGKPVEASAVNPEAVAKGTGKAKFAVDGIVDRTHHWDGISSPSWLKIDLEKSHKLKSIQVITYWDGKRYYKYNVEVSPDGKRWKKVVDFSKNKKPATARGFTHKIKPIKARYIRVNMLGNSANPSVHLVEVRAFE